jgi:glutamate 5-kinase
MAGGAGSSIGRGGMITKVLAAKRAARSGASTVIAWGREPDVLLRLARGEAIGTALLAPTPKLAARKQWMADHLQLRGAVVVDDGAAAKLRDDGKSLLPIGVVEVQGEFHRGDVIAVRARRLEIARGLANYSSSEARLIARKPSSEIRALLGFTGEPEMIHRDNLVLAERRERSVASASRPSARRRPARGSGRSARRARRRDGAAACPSAGSGCDGCRAAGSARARSAPSGRRRA